MDPVISNLIDHYEKGRLSRRDLVAGLSALAAAGAAPTLAGAQGAAPAALKPVGIDHVSILVRDLERSKEFYARVFGLVSVSEEPEHKIVRLAWRDPAQPPGGRGGRVQVSLRQAEPYGTTDHWSFKIENFNRAQATQMLTAHGLKPTETVDYGFHVIDPDGVVVQVI